MRAVSGGCRNAPGSDGDSGMRYSTSTATQSQADYVSGTTDGGPAVHMDSSGNGYIETAYNGVDLFIFRLDAGSYTELFNGTGVYSAGQPNKIRRAGNTLVVSKNGSDVLTSPSDTAYTGGNPGIFGYAADLIQDNWTDGAAGAADFPITIAQGSYALTGQTVALRAARRLTCAQGSYSLTGQAVTLRMTRGVLAVAPGSYALNGQGVTLAGPIVGYSLSMTQGGYTYTGSDAAIDNAITLVSGSYALNGQAAGLKYGHKITCTQGSYALNGQAVALKAARVISAAQGSYALNGQAVSLRQTSYKLTALTGSYLLDGRTVILRYSGANIDMFLGRPLDPRDWWFDG